MSVARWFLIALLALPLPARADALTDLAADLAAKFPAHGRAAIEVRPRDPSTARIAQSLSGLLLGRMQASPIEGGATAARRAGFEVLVDVEVAIENGEVVALARVLSVERDLWREIANPDGGQAIASIAVGRARIDADLRALVGGPPPVTPTTPAPPRRWSFRALDAGLDLGAPLLALAAVDLDGDRRAELVALTTDEIIVLRFDGSAASPLARVRLDGRAVLPRPRTPVGTLVGERLAARSSEHGPGASYAWQNGALVKTGSVDGYPVCAGAANLVAGAAIFAGSAPLPERFLAAGCGAGATGSVDASGILRLIRGGAAWAIVPGVGTAFAIADLDGDGVPEVVTAANRAPGTGDLLAVQKIGGDGSARPARKPTAVPGGVAAIAAGDLDGDGVVDVLAAARAPGETQVELWLLE